MDPSGPVACWRQSEMKTKAIVPIPKCTTRTAEEPHGGNVQRLTNNNSACNDAIAMARFDHPRGGILV